MAHSYSKKVSIPVITVIGLCVCIAWLAGAFNDKVSPDIIPPEVTRFNDVFKVTAKNQLIYEPVSASITAKQASIISSRILARIDEINVRAGDNVVKGQLLVKLEQSDLTSQVQQAKEQINVIKARQLEAKNNYKRSTEIHQQNLISDVELDKSKANFDALTAELSTAQQAINQAKTLLSYSELTAPINGRIVDRFAEPGDTAQPGSKLLSLYNPLSLRIEGQVREALALNLQQGQQINVELPSINKTFIATIEEIVPAANTGSRSFLVKASIEYQEQLLPGMYAKMLIPAGDERVLIIPKNRVAQLGQLSVVWVNNNGQAQRRFVRLGKETPNGFVSVISGLAVGDEIIAIP